MTSWFLAMSSAASFPSHTLKAAHTAAQSTVSIVAVAGKHESRPSTHPTFGGHRNALTERAF